MKLPIHNINEMKISGVSIQLNPQENEYKERYFQWTPYNLKTSFNGQEIIPYDLVLRHLPPAPKTEDEIRQILNEGLISDDGYMEVSAIGKKDGRDIEVITLVNAPGLAESFAKSGITAEMYLTGQGGFLFSKLMLEGHMHQTGLMTSDMLTMDQVDLYFDYAKDLDITLSTRTVDITGWGSTDPDF